MANGIINLTSDAIGFEGRIMWGSVLDEANKRSTLTLSYQIRRTSGGANSSNYSVSASIKGVTAAGIGPTYHNYNTSGNILIGDTTNWKTLTTSTHTVYHSDWSGKAAVAITCTIKGGVNGVTWTAAEVEIALDRIFKKASITSAPNFTDEDNPTIYYDRGYVDTLEAAIYDTSGYTSYASYRSIDIYGSSYTFTLTTAERNKLIAAANSSTSIKVRFYLKMTIEGAGSIPPVYKEVTLTIADAGAPTITASIEDTQTLTKNLTGGGLKFIRGNNSMKYTMTATGKKGATIKSYSVICGSQKKTTTSGTLTNIENEVVIFSATDSRGKTATKTINLEPIDYIKLTCNQEVKMILESEDSAQMSLKIDGNYFNGSFGAKNNTLTIYTRHRRNNESYSEWGDITPLLASNTGGRYTLSANMSGFDPSGTYTFQCKAVDALGEAITSEYAVQFMPVFDWSKNDFNFNVPISIEGNPLADYVIEEGVEAMGTNGTWYWRKWKSGRADCYGVRNYGNMAVTTAWGGLYRSESFSQSLPSGLFIDTPEVIDITYRVSNYGGWIAQHEATAPSSSNTGGFIVVRPASATLSQARIGFNVIGRWK